MDLPGLADSVLVFFGFAALLATGQVWRRQRTPTAPKNPLTSWLFVYGVAGIASSMWLRPMDMTTGSVIAGAAAVSLLARRRLHDLHLDGFLLASATVLLRISLVAWMAALAATADVDLVSSVCLWVLVTATAVATPTHLLDSYLTQEVLCRDTWTRAERPADSAATGFKISVHLPCYAEPPHVVITTLDALAGQTYTNFEVVVVDNNTRVEELWRPVQRHCEKLGSRFRFFHVDPLSGAKAGALNFALQQTDAEVELIAVVDADYRAEPDFLIALSGHFRDVQLGFVQTRHDYRGWEDSGYLRGCYGEYRLMYASYMVSRSERNAALTTGTMCLVRRRVLDAVGGWAEWCSTEDSELAIRIHAAGFSGLYLPETYGRGLIPEDFAGYRRQRFRWIHGPTQEFRRHWRLFLPRRWAAPSHLSPVQKLLFANHGLRDLVGSATGALVFLSMLALAIDLSRAPSEISLPAAVLAALVVNTLLGGLATLGTLHHRCGFSWADSCRALVSRMALTDVTRFAGLAGWVSVTARFRRTSKFRPSSTLATVLRGSLREGACGVLTLVAVCDAVLRKPADNMVIALGLSPSCSR